MSKSLGTDPDLEKLARQVRRAGGSVTFDGSNHLVWQLPNGQVVRTGLTMKRNNAHYKALKIRRAMAS